jgi:hypothetical protein
MDELADDSGADLAVAHHEGEDVYHSADGVFRRAELDELQRHGVRVTIVAVAHVDKIGDYERSLPAVADDE